MPVTGVVGVEVEGPISLSSAGGEGWGEREVAAAADHGGLSQVTEGGADLDARAERPARQPAEVGQERRRRVGERVVGEHPQGERRDAVARAVDGAEAGEQQVPSGEVVRARRRASPRHAAARDAPVHGAIERRHGQIEARERRDAPAVAGAQRGEEAGEEPLLGARARLVDPPGGLR